MAWWAMQWTYLSYFMGEGLKPEQLYIFNHSMTLTLQENHVRLITLLFEVGFYNYFTAMITILK